MFFFVKSSIKAFHFNLNILIIKLSRFILNSLRRRFLIISIYFKLYINIINKSDRPNFVNNVIIF